eukprot:NODE_2798_length_1088_cov_44.376691_g2668_i0.p1 GENE.NODE_2798_length_1088_cov_44.376691_g2668_i0~~NODE_2798_length_1088_cov_44.376691_g2668_i0.p1  ORF type:complete len:315 (+),score=73.07 NODE_2798_length_1088_cov_44.376691_g2668_i0:124-945(+)
MEQEWATEGAQITFQKALAGADGQPNPNCQTTVIQQLSLVNAQQSNYSFAIANQFRNGHIMGRIDNQGSVVGIAQQSVGSTEGFLQWTKRGQYPPDMYFSAESTPQWDAGGSYSFKFIKGMETSLQYLKSFGKCFSFGSELKYQFPLRKTCSTVCMRWKIPEKKMVWAGELSCNSDLKLSCVRKLAPSTSVAVELDHKAEKGETNVRLGSQIDYIGQSSIRLQVDPDLRVKAMATAPLGRGNMLMQMIFQWDPKTRNFRQGIDLKLQGGAFAG